MNFFSKIGNNFKTNAKNIIISFLIAIAAWLFVSVQIFPTVEESIKNVVIDVQPTEYMLRNNLEIIGDYSELVDIRIEGNRYDITGLSKEDFTASLDLTTVRSAGTFTVPVNVMGEIDGEYTLLDANPSSVTIQIDEIVTREFRLTATAPNISLPEGFYVEGFVPNPSSISITGSVSELDKIDRVEARSKHSGIISESHDTQGEIVIYGTNGSIILNSNLKLSTKEVTVNIPVYKKKELPLTFEFVNVPSYFDIDSLKFEIQPPSITVAAPDNSIDNLSELAIDAVDISDIRLNQTVSTIPIKLPDGYKNLSGNNSARIVWDIADYGKLDFAVSNISFINQPDNFDVDIVTKMLSITVIGPSESLSSLTSADFYVTANLLGETLREGTQDVAVSIMMRGQNRECWATGSYRITIDVTPKPAE